MSIYMTLSTSGSAYAQGSGSVRFTSPKMTGQRFSAGETAVSSADGSGEQEFPFDINTAIADLEKISSTLNNKLRFSVDHETNEIIVKVIDPDTEKVVKILPPEELRWAHGKIKEALGVLFDELI